MDVRYIYRIIILVVVSLVVVGIANYCESAEYKVYGGISSVQSDYSELESPLGYFGVEYVVDNGEFYVEHISSIPNRHDYGLNLVGYNYVYRVDKDVKLYGGMAIHDGKIDDKDNYGGEVSDLMVRFGARYKWMFVEKLSNMVQSGVRIEF